MSDSDEHSLFRQLMHDVKPLKKTKVIEPVQEKKTKPEKIHQQEIETSSVPYQDNLDKQYHSNYKKLTPYQVVHPSTSIHFSEDLQNPITSDSILNYKTENLSDQHFSRLCKGQIQIDSKIDLHGLERYEAQDRLYRYLEHAKSHGLRTLLVIHGKGSRHGETPILKQHLYLWLRHYPSLLAMHSAHAKHGGTGALYVLLKKSHKNKNT
jgi:DNA-nicking Smr family endonuclease